MVGRTEARQAPVRGIRRASCGYPRLGRGILSVRRPPPVRRARDPGTGGTATKGVAMRLGTAIVLLALGAILAFALRVDLSGIDLQLVGWILMIVGALGIVLELAVWGPRNRRRVTHSEGYAAPAAGAPVQRTTTDETY